MSISHHAAGGTVYGLRSTLYGLRCRWLGLGPLGGSYTTVPLAWSVIGLTVSHTTHDERGCR